MEAVGAEKSESLKVEGLKVDVPASHVNRTGGSEYDFQTLDLKTFAMCIWDMDWLIEKSDLACNEYTHHLPHTQHGQTHCIISV
jgi:hypothetical protein